MSPSAGWLGGYMTVGNKKEDVTNSQPAEKIENSNQKPWSETVREYQKEKGILNWLGIVADARNEFPEDIQELIAKKISKQTLKGQEQSKFDLAINKWWKETFSISLSLRQRKVKEIIPDTTANIIDETKEQHKTRKYNEATAKKVDRMEQLHRALVSLDEGEPVEEFRDETRRVLYFDEDKGQYFVGEGEQKKYLEIGDIVADYAWDIKYAPDGEMIEPACRTAAKRILINETRRDIEILRDIGIRVNKPQLEGSVFSFSLSTFKSNLKGAGTAKIRADILLNNFGYFTETSLRELLTRVSIKYDTDFTISRSSILEDGEYKYDFKIRTKSRLRGVMVDKKPLTKSVGLQLKTKLKLFKITSEKYPEEKGKRIGVDEIILIKVPTRDFIEALEKWLKQGEPSGGPEQFLSRDLKIEILKAVTKDLVEISDEEIKRIFPKEESPATI